jgi:TPR repeat protein
MIIALSGCLAKRFINNNLVDYNYSVRGKNYAQAAIRLERCASLSSDSRECRNIRDGLLKSGLPLADAIKKDHEKKLAIDQKEKEIAEKSEEVRRIKSLRDSNNPWDNLSLALEIQAGTVEKISPDEDKKLIEKAFFGFGECAKQTNPACMTQYAQMILYGIDFLPEDKKKSASEKALYWLKLSARYGNEGARRLLISLEQDIPTPDLSMEILQKEANAIAVAEMDARKLSEKQRLDFSAQMVQEAKRANFISSMRYFFPKAVNCTSTKIGSYTYTNCY